MIRIVTDSTPTLPREIISEFNITVMPTHIYFGSQSFLDGVDLSASEFYQRLAKVTELPTTAQSSVEEFRQLYAKLLSETPGATIISIHVSGSLSGFTESARGAAALFPDAKIRIFDSRSIAPGQGLMVREAARMARDNAPEEDILKRLEVMRDGMKLYWMFDTLEYLAKSGRIGRAARFMGGLLDLKPVLTLKNGAIDTYGRTRGRLQAIGAVRDLVIKDAAGQKGVHLGIAYSVTEEDARRFGDELRAAINPEIYIFTELGPSLGVYAGPGAVGAYWWVPNRSEPAPAS